MTARSLIGSIEHAVHGFYASVIKHEVSDANVQGFLQAASQIAEVWQTADDRVTAAIQAGTAPWEAYASQKYALAFIRAARTYQVFVEGLLAANAAADPATSGYLPHVTYDQANALCHQIQPLLQHAVAAVNDPAYVPDMRLPLTLEPRIEAEGEPCPIAHLQGMINAAREVREWASGLLSQYALAVEHATMPVPPEITAHLTTFRRMLAEGDSQLRFGIDLVGQLSTKGASEELHEQAEDNLWEAMRTFFLLNQAAAEPRWLEHSEPTTGSASRRRYRDRRIKPADLWRIAAPSARAELSQTQFGQDEMVEMCEKMGGVLSAGAQQYLDDVDAAVARNDAISIAAMATCPFDPLYRARVAIDIAGAQIPAGYEFHWDYHRGHIEIAKRYNRTPEWKECEE